ncbi:hypothetical protein OBBRIDRAFT_829275 [Obba rivulosa]|uniref:RNase H type-1 domain-containing protein n=1 Tax=Obba rivulosa TaxID=1052685 RepID=A0A8E2AHX0_9APHY|nr:hypothetical protein OBBRIDRAFT_829275 [Obba rivulosa]
MVTSWSLHGRWSIVTKMELQRTPTEEGRRATFLFPVSHAVHFPLRTEENTIFLQRSAQHAVHVHWCPSHIGIAANEFVDNQAKEGLREEAPDTVSLSAARSDISTRMRRAWQSQASNPLTTNSRLKPSWIVVCRRALTAPSCWIWYAVPARGETPLQMPARLPWQLSTRREARAPDPSVAM